MPSLRMSASGSNAVTTKTMINRTSDLCRGVLKECYMAIVCYWLPIQPIAATHSANFSACLYRKPKLEPSGDEARLGWRAKL